MEKIITGWQWFTTDAREFTTVAQAVTTDFGGFTTDSWGITTDSPVFSNSPTDETYIPPSTSTNNLLKSRNFKTFTSDVCYTYY
ncbi:hypothetical protein [Sporosarcina koreensis]|uniref:hypothetical protein n=1 Tax=Sporosarcina koreensis TaxID=334735 RepID=UPI000AF18593|nr:hypothetical protein [Sporosarcina koreensis]